jgi:transposase
MKFKVFIGVDVSKETLDFAVFYQGGLLFHMQVENSAKGIKSFMKLLIARIVIDDSELLFCMEHTGIYCNHLLAFVEKNSMALWFESAAEIRSFYGLLRGKNDKLDAKRIAGYAYSKRDKIKLYEPPRPIVKQLKYLLKIRERLVNTRKKLKTPIQEADGFVDPSLVKTEKRLFNSILVQIELKINQVEKQIEEIIKADPELKRLYTLVSSVMGVGFVISTHMIVATNEFKTISEPKKMACHCGVAPFEYQSGKSIKGRSKVSHRANMGLKWLMHMAAMSAISSDKELQNYYNRKVEEGKNKMLVLNAVRNKIIHRVFACVNQNRKYEKIYIRMVA